MGSRSRKTFPYQYAGCVPKIVGAVLEEVELHVGDERREGLAPGHPVDDAEEGHGQQGGGQHDSPKTRKRPAMSSQSPTTAATGACWMRRQKPKPSSTPDEQRLPPLPAALLSMISPVRTKAHTMHSIDAGSLRV